MTVNTRSDLIRDTIVAGITEGTDHLHVSPCDAAAWPMYPDAPYHRYGWRPAMVGVHDDGTTVLTVPICADVIAEQTAGMTDGALQQYLTVVIALSSLIAQRLDEVLSRGGNVDDEVIRKIVHASEEQLDKVNPQAMRYLTHVIIDHLTVPWSAP